MQLGILYNPVLSIYKESAGQILKLLLSTKRKRKKKRKKKKTNNNNNNNNNNATPANMINFKTFLRVNI